MKEIVKLIMERDGLSWDEAKGLVLETRRLIRQAVQEGFWDDAEIILQDELGLEPDHILELM